MSPRPSPDLNGTSRNQNPAEMLVGQSLDGGWTVVEKVVAAPGASGGAFSVPYIVQNSDGRTAFLKALDYSEALSSDDIPGNLERLVAAFNFERDLLNECARMSRVITALADGSIEIADMPPGSIPTVNYLIFELADRGDVRRYLDRNTLSSQAWKLRALHNTAVGLSQLHAARISHQDLKPSNVLVFSGRGTKIGDLGRSVRSGVRSPHEDLTIAAQPVYAPPELLYGYVPADWSRYRLGVDLYQLGSLATFLFSGAGITASMMTYLPTQALPGAWGGSYTDVLPVVRDAYNRVMDAARADFDVVAQPGGLEAMVRELTDPDPDHRGDPMRRRTGANPYGLERFVSRLDLMCRRTELALRQSGGTS